MGVKYIIRKSLDKLFESKFLTVYILLVALTLRLVALNQSFWLDEAIGALVVRNLEFKEILTQFSRSDFHPPLYYLILKFWTNLFGYSESALRSLSVVLGTATVYLTYLIAIKILKKRFAVLFSTLLIATSQLHIYFSQEARMYVMTGFFAALCVYFFLYILEKTSVWRWVGFSVCLTALIFTDYVPIFFVPVFWIWGFYKKMNFSWWKKLLLAHIPLVITGLLFLPIFLAQLKVGEELTKTLPAWSSIVGGSNIKQLALVWIKFTLGRISFRDKPIYYLLVLLSSIPFAVSLFKSWKLKTKPALMLHWLLIPLVLSFLFSFLFPAFSYFRFIFLLPAFYIILAAGVTAIINQKLRYVISASLIIVNLTSWAIYVKDPHQQRERWREAVAFVEERIKKDEVVLLEYPQPLAAYEWYAKDLSVVRGATDSINADIQKTSEKTKKTLVGVKGVYYFEYLRDLTDPQRVVEGVLESVGFKKAAVYDFFPGVGQITYYTQAN